MKGTVTVLESGFARTAILFTLMITGILFMLQSWTAAASGVASFPFSPAFFGQISWMVVALSSIVAVFRRDPGILFSSVGLLYFGVSAWIGPGAGLKSAAAGFFFLTAWCGRHCLATDSEKGLASRAIGPVRRWRLERSLRRAARASSSGVPLTSGCLEVWERALESAALAREAIVSARVMGASGLEGAEKKIGSLIGSVAESLCREARIREFLRAEAGRRRVSRGELAVVRGVCRSVEEGKGARPDAISRVDTFIDNREETRRSLSERASRFRASAVGVIAALDSVRYSATLCGQEGSESLNSIEEEAVTGAVDLDEEVRCLAGELRLLGS